MALAEEIVQLLAEHSAQPLDYVALFMFLNTVGGGHYQERCTEAELNQALVTLERSGRVETLDTRDDGRPRAYRLSVK